MVTNPFPSIVTGPATSITGCYHTQWCDRNRYPAGTRVMCLYSPLPKPWDTLVGEIITLSDDEFGRDERLWITALQVKGARFNTVEALQ